MPYIALGLLVSTLSGIVGHLAALPLRLNETLYFFAGALLIIGSLVILLGEV